MHTIDKQNACAIIFKPIKLLLALFVYSNCNQVLADPTLFLFDLLPAPNTHIPFPFETNEKLEASKSTSMAYPEVWREVPVHSSEITLHKTYSWIFHLDVSTDHYLTHRFPNLSPSVWMFRSSYSTNSLNDDDDVGPDTTYFDPRQEAEDAEMVRNQQAAQMVNAEEAFSYTGNEVNSDDENALINCPPLTQEQIESVRRYLDRIRTIPGYNEAALDEVLARTFNDRFNVAGAQRTPQELNVLSDEYFHPNIDLFARSGIGLFYLPSCYAACPSSYRIVCIRCYRDLGSPGNYLNNFLAHNQDPKEAHRCPQQGQPYPETFSHARPERQNQLEPPLPMQSQTIDYSHQATRQHSFLTVMHLFPGTQTAERFAAAGFFYAGYQQNSLTDSVQCFSCGLCLKNWQPEDTPESEHRRHQPDCRFIMEMDQDRVRRHQTLPPPQPSDFIELSARLASFTDAIHNFHGQTAQELADAGLYYTGTRDHEHPSQDTVRCFHCRSLLYEWEKGDNPVDEHSHLNPKCQFIMKKIQERQRIRDQQAQLQASFENLGLKNSEQAIASPVTRESLSVQLEHMGEIPLYRFAEEILSEGLEYDPEILRYVLTHNTQNLDDKTLILDIYKATLSERSSSPDQEQHHENTAETPFPNPSDAVQSILEVFDEYPRDEVMAAEADLTRQNVGTAPSAEEILRQLQERNNPSSLSSQTPATNRSPLEEMQERHSRYK